MRKDLFDKLLLNSAFAMHLLSGVVFNGYQIFAASFAEVPFYFRYNHRKILFPVSLLEALSAWSSGSAGPPWSSRYNTLYQKHGHLHIETVAVQPVARRITPQATLTFLFTTSVEIQIQVCEKTFYTKCSFFFF